MKSTILHISDLHRDPANPLKNSALLESLLRDRDHYALETTRIPAPSLIVVSGDIISGTKKLDGTGTGEIRQQYDEAQDFLERLAREFLDGDIDRLVIVPGNHDVSYPAAMAALSQVDLTAGAGPAKSVVAQQLKRLYAPESRIRWSWEDLAFYEWKDRAAYDSRMEAYCEFFGRLYSGRRVFPVDPAKQFCLYEYPNLGITFVALSSCHNNDPLNRLGSMNAESISHASAALRAGTATPVRCAVWHHSASGPPWQLDYMDGETLQVLIDCGYNLGLHGHQHRPQHIEEAGRFGIDRRMMVLSAGTLCGGAPSLPSGQVRSYNLLEVDTELSRGRVHLREMQNGQFESPIWGPGIFRTSRSTFVDFEIQRPSGPDNRRTRQLVEAEEALARREYSKVIESLSPLAASDDMARRLLAEALVEGATPREVIGALYPPRSSTEWAYVAGAAWETGDAATAKGLLAALPANVEGTPPLRELKNKLQRMST